MRRARLALALMLAPALAVAAGADARTAPAAQRQLTHLGPDLSRDIPKRLSGSNDLERQEGEAYDEVMESRGALVVRAS